VQCRLDEHDSVEQLAHHRILRAAVPFRERRQLLGGVGVDGGLERRGVTGMLLGLGIEKGDGV
jgi:hypothetical protein